MPSLRPQTHPCLRGGLQALAAYFTLCSLPVGLFLSLLSGLDACCAPIPCSVPMPGVQALTVIVSLCGDTETVFSGLVCCSTLCSSLGGGVCPSPPVLLLLCFLLTVPLGPSVSFLLPVICSS